MIVKANKMRSFNLILTLAASSCALSNGQDAANTASNGFASPSLSTNKIEKIRSVAEQMKNITDQWADLDFPSIRDFRQRSKPFTVNIEGIVGTGKSTFLEFFKGYPLIDILQEPVDKWTNINGTDMLELLFNQPERWGFAQESYVQLTMLEHHLRKFGVAKVMERSLYSARSVFIENLYRSKLLKPVEYNILDKWHNFLYYIPEFDISTDLTVYLRADPEKVVDRIKHRGRPEEKNITLDFLKGIHKLHEDWLLHKNSSFPLPSKRVIVIDANLPIAQMKYIYKSLAQKIWNIIPRELKSVNVCQGSQ